MSANVISLEHDFGGAPVVVTGVGRAGQAGEAVARAFAERGAVVHCVDRDGDAARERVADLRAAGLRGVAHVVDLTDADAANAVAAAIARDSAGRVAAVAAVAGGFAMSGPIAESDPSIYLRMIAINLTSAYTTARAFAPHVRAASGAFVFVTSAAVLPGGRVAGMAGYAMAKGGLIQLVRALAQEEREHGVRVNAVAPTMLRTAQNMSSMGSDARYVEREAFAAAIVALCTPASRNATGQIIELA